MAEITPDCLPISATLSEACTDSIAASRELRTSTKPEPGHALSRFTSKVTRPADFTLGDRVPADAQTQVAQARAAHPALDKMLTMREELRQMWMSTTLTREQLTANLAAWCKRADDSGIARLQAFSQRLRAAHA